MHSLVVAFFKRFTQCFYKQLIVLNYNSKAINSCTIFCFTLDRLVSCYSITTQSSQYQRVSFEATERIALHSIFHTARCARMRQLRSKRLYTYTKGDFGTMHRRKRLSKASSLWPIVFAPLSRSPAGAD